MYKRPLSSKLCELGFWVIMAAVAMMLFNAILISKCEAGVLAECETDSECKEALDESLLIIDQSTIPEALKWYCSEYPERDLGIGPMARTYSGHPIEIESCAQVVQSEEYERV